MVKVVYILSLIFKSLEYEWIVRYLDKSRVDLTFILLNPTKSELQHWLEVNGIRTYHVPYYGKKSYLRCIFRVVRILRSERPDFVNCNLLDANMIGLTSAFLVNVRNRIYTRHHSTFHHVYFKKGRFYDLLANKMATQIVAVSSLVRKVLIEYENVPEEKIRLIPHGFGIPDFENVDVNRVARLRNKYLLDDNFPVIGVISRYVEWKGVQYIIPAFAEVLKVYPKAVLLLANAKQGAFTPQIERLVNKLPPESYREIEFESDILAFYKLLNVFVHAPIDDHSEAFGRIYPESLASGVPVVCTISGIAHDIIQNGVNAIVVDYKNPIEITNAILKIINNPDLALSLSQKAKEITRRMLNMDVQKALLEKLYLESDVK